MRTVRPALPGEMLEEECLNATGLTKYRLAKDLGAPSQRSGAILAGKRSVASDTGRRLCLYFDRRNGWWLCGQKKTSGVR